MNCLEFRRLMLGEPGNLPAYAREHMVSCPGCSEFARRADRFEAELAEAMAVPVPANLTERVLLNHGLQDGRRARFLAIMASALLAVGITLSAGYYATAPDPYVLDHSIKHVLGEPSALKARQVVTRADLEAALARSGARLMADFGAAVTYLHDCPVPGGLGKHMVLDTPAGKITVITMPNQRVMRRGTMEAGGLVAAVMPAQQGSYAIVTPSHVSLARAEQTLRQYVNWTG